MKLVAKNLSLLIPFTAGIASAQTQNLPNVQHVIVVIQENRTPDNLFHEDTALVNSGADVVTSSGPLQTECGQISLASAPLNACFDPDHSHKFISGYSNGAWEKTYDNGKMDGACKVNVGNGLCVTWNQNPPCLSNSSCTYTYADNSPLPTGAGVLQPYFDMASNYAFSNYTFQTNQGPSFEAHQFLFSGTSAPDDPNDLQYKDTCTEGDGDPCYEWFASELQNNNTDDYGCPDTAGDIAEVDPSGDDLKGIYRGGVPCYSHNSLADLLDANSVSWGYYPQGLHPNTSLWTAPNAISGVCMPLDQNTGYCSGGLWKYLRKTPYSPIPCGGDWYGPDPDGH
jgi:hypothetical protein